MLVVTEPFAALARHASGAHGLPGARIAVVSHPLGGLRGDAVDALATTAVEIVLGALTPASGTTTHA